jgi:hypothetical protein
MSHGRLLARSRLLHFKYTPCFLPIRSIKVSPGPGGVGGGVGFQPSKADQRANSWTSFGQQS